MADQKIFEVVQLESPNRNSFDMTFDHKTTLDMGELVPICVMECLPGDRFTIGSECLVRFAPMIAPTMQRYDARIEYFFVPNRIIWDSWMEYISSDPSAVGTHAFPYFNINAGNYTPLLNYFGIPRPAGGNTEKVNALPVAAYQYIWDQYYRDQNLIPTQWYKLSDGDNTASLGDYGILKNRAWEHDYFTSCLPFAQKGNAVTIGTTSYTDVPVLANTGTTGQRLDLTGVEFPSGLTNTTNAQYGTPTAGSTGIGARQLFADTSELDALSVTINDLREAEALQKWLEINARAGTRPNEVIAGHFGVRSSDARLQRPEYIVGVKQPVSVSEVLNTAGLESGGSGSPLATMGGHGVGMIDDQNYGSYFCEEHGFIIGLLSIIPKTCYTTSMDKFWLKYNDVTDYFWPSFAHLGEQPVQRREICAFQGATGADVFGYLPAYQDYRYMSSKVTGDFQTSLSFWTAARNFDPAAPPQLNEDFVTCVPTKDIFAVNDPDVDNLYVHVLNKIYASRLVPVYGTPSLT